MSGELGTQFANDIIVNGKSRSNWFFSAILFLIAMGSLTVGLRHFMLFSQPVPFDHADIEISTICHQLTDKWEKHGFKGVVSELETIEGPEKVAPLPFIRDLVNTELSARLGEMVASSQIRKEAHRRLNEVLKEKTWSEKDPDFKWTPPDFFLTAKWDWAVPQESFQLTLRLVRLSLTAEFVEATGKVVYPPYAKKAQHLKMKSLAWMIGASVFFLLSMGGLLSIQQKTSFSP